MTKIDYQVPKEDNWYKWHGQKPPERIPHLTDEERTEIMQANIARHQCVFYQNGAFAVCDIDEFEHGKKIPNGMQLDKDASDKAGKPMFKKYGPILRSQINNA